MIKCQSNVECANEVEFVIQEIKLQNVGSISAALTDNLETAMICKECLLSGISGMLDDITKEGAPLCVRVVPIGSLPQSQVDHLLRMSQL